MHPALRAFNLRKVNAADSVRLNRVSALRADRVERCHNFFEIDSLLVGHGRLSHAQRRNGGHRRQMLALGNQFPPLLGAFHLVCGGVLPNEFAAGRTVKRLHF